jgi:hypothetical protein
MGVGHAVVVAVAKVDAAEYGDDWSAGAESTEESADLVHDMLAGQFPPGNVHRLYTRAATATAVQERIGGLGAKSEDLVVLYVTCHGGYRTLADRREQALYLHDRKLGIAELASLVRPLPCRCVVIADACHTREPPVAPATARAVADGWREVLYYGAAVEATDGNLFTRLLTRLAPVASDYRDLAKRLQAAARTSGGLQEPVFFADRASGSFVGSKPFAV